VARSSKRIDRAISIVKSLNREALRQSGIAGRGIREFMYGGDSAARAGLSAQNLRQKSVIATCRNAPVTSTTERRFESVVRDCGRSSAMDEPQARKDESMLVKAGSLSAMVASTRPE
jgi:hypothetical protein